MEWEFDPEEYEREKSGKSPSKSAPVEHQKNKKSNDPIDEDMDFLDFPDDDNQKSGRVEPVIDDHFVDDRSAVFNAETQQKIKETQDKIAVQASALKDALVARAASIRSRFYSWRANRMVAKLETEKNAPAAKPILPVKKPKTNDLRDPFLLNDTIEIKDNQKSARVRTELYTAPNTKIYAVIVIAIVLGAGYWAFHEKINLPGFASNAESKSGEGAIAPEKALNLPSSIEPVAPVAQQEVLNDPVDVQRQKEEIEAEQDRVARESQSALEAEKARDAEIARLIEADKNPNRPIVTADPAPAPTRTQAVSETPTPKPAVRQQPVKSTTQQDEERRMYEEEMRKLDAWGEKMQNN